MNRASILIIIFLAMILLNLIIGLITLEYSYLEVTDCYDNHDNQIIGIDCLEPTTPRWLDIYTVINFTTALIIGAFGLYFLRIDDNED